MITAVRGGASPDQAHPVRSPAHQGGATAGAHPLPDALLHPSP
ncbi:hypothetical protein EV189_0279 [Motilibacter rhizosphaerae]|uniref:Uncharacterized protein n=1 Tax=Motilibacter rhizosphaerae TaxID=598652 RepID=A0A4Q7NV34_9ACTN|nr:hypothetical protein EV189_0279 [Motilibacter rhizosphaerae]